MRRLFRSFAFLSCLFAGLGAANTSSAANLHAPAAPDNINIDGIPGEWVGQWQDAKVNVSGSADGFEAKVQLAWAADGIYLAADVRDQKLDANKDRVEFVVGIPGGAVQTFFINPGVAGKSRATVKLKNGRSVRGAKVVEAANDGGYTIEAKLPWSAFPKSATVRIGYRGVIRVREGGSGAVIATADGSSYASLPGLSGPAELALGAGLLREKGLTRAPQKNLLANVFGDRLLERVMVFDRYLVIMGPNYRGGAEYYYRDLGAHAGKDVLEFKVNDLTGDGKADLWLRKRARGDRGSIELVEVLSFDGQVDVMSPVFQHEVAFASKGGKTVKNTVRLSGSGRSARIEIRPGTSPENTPATFSPETNTGAKPMLSPFGMISMRRFAFKGGEFAVEKETEQDAPPKPRSTSPKPRPYTKPPPASPHPRPGPKASGPELDRVYSLYKKKRKVTGPARFDLSGNLEGSKTLERLVVHGRDLVVFGKDFKDGRSYAALTLNAFASARDIKSVTLKDTTGDGRKEVLIRGIVHTDIPSDIGAGEMLRTVVMVYKVSERTGLTRIFAAEVGRQIDTKRVDARITFSRGAIELRPGKARGYSERTYPWKQKKEPSDGFEPLLLPWGGIPKVRLKFKGNRFAR